MNLILELSRLIDGGTCKNGLLRSFSIPAVIAISRLDATNAKACSALQA